MRNWIMLSLSTILLTSWTYPYEDKHVTPVFKEIPVMKVNVYMMGRDVADDRITVKIFDNIQQLNASFEGEISFIFNELFMDPNHAYLPDLYKSFQEGQPEILEPIVEPIEKTGAINVFLFDTYTEEGKTAALMGFTPMLRAKQEAYNTTSPRYDRILMAYEGLEESKTLIHEMGHFFGLRHPWELSDIAKWRLGIKTDHDEAQNHMSYGSKVESFTAQQIDEMRRYALNYRKYLMERVVRVYAGL